MVGSRRRNSLAPLALGAAIAMAAGSMPACSTITETTARHGRRPADVEFSLRPDATREARRAVAVELWRSGSVSSVASPDREPGGRLYKVFVKEPGNLVQIQDVYLRLRRLPEVLSVHSAAARLVGDERL